MVDTRKRFLSRQLNSASALTIRATATSVDIFEWLGLEQDCQEDYHVLYDVLASTRDRNRKLHTVSLVA